MASSSSSSSTVLVAGSLLVAAGLAGLGFMNFAGSNSSNNNNPREITDIDDLDGEGEGDYLTAKEVSDVFDQLLKEMQAVFMQLMQQVQQLQMQGSVNLSEAHLRALVRGEMERTLMIKQKMVLESMDMDYDCFEEATWEFLEKEDEYPQVKKSVERFQKLWQTATGEIVVGWRPGKTEKDLVGDGKEAEILSPERLLEVADKYFSAFPRVMGEIMAEYRAEGKNLQQPAVQQQLNMDFSTRANEAGEAVLEECGVTMMQFEASVKAHQDNATVARGLTMLQARQQQEMMALSSA